MMFTAQLNDLLKKRQYLHKCALSYICVDTHHKICSTLRLGRGMMCQKMSIEHIYYDIIQHSLKADICMGRMNLFAENPIY